ncbi:MAG TPA: histidine phosphatase family protein [Spirochaetia bacterium]|nr:histidine phosphatase family protein [Spirochaetia bacterium]
METKIILARHGLTEWNVQGRYQGRQECRLSEQGKLESGALAVALAPVPLVGVYTSPLSRSAETARMVARRHGLDVVALPGLTEICHGDWEGRLVGEVARQWGGLLARWRATPYDVRMPGGETLAEVEERVWPALEQVTVNHPGRTVLLVTHDTPLRVILKRILGLTEDGFWRLRLDNAGLSELGFRADSGFRVLRLNDTCHLQGLPGHDQEAL